VPAAILESELFGHAKVSSSTGAERERAGRIASAAGGTLLLDEIAEIAPEAQAKVSRLLKSGEFQRVGSHRTEKADVRIVAATHQDLEPLVQAGRFRQDLYLALKVIELRVPPLRERLGDLPLLVEHFLRKYWKRSNPLPRLSRHMKQALASHRFPGNVRELEHLIERACLLSDGPKLEVDLPPAEPAPAAPSGSWGFERYDNEELKIAREAALAEVERQFLCGLLERWDGNVSRAAREAGIHRTYLQRLIAEHRPLRAESGPLDTASRPEVDSLHRKPSSGAFKEGNPWP
jgi:Nif-specific regulatory protein/two-component system response regulator HydG